jgi:hypothetical protein
VTQGSPEKLVEAGGGRRLEIELSTLPDNGLPGPLGSFAPSLDGRLLSISTPHPRRILPEVLSTLYGAELGIDEVRIVESSLEEVFIRLTGRSIDVDTAVAGPDAAPPHGGPVEAA